MGHALNGSVQDTLIRLARMRGQRTKWIFGTDHAGIATQTQVERLLNSEGTSREALGREAFVERVWRWREQYGSTIVEQFKRLGASCDYEDERFTLDEAYARAVQKVFVDLYDKGLIYRDNYMVNWDPGSRSAISDLEVEDREVTDTLYYVDYPLASGDGSVTVATVRPETMLADTAIAVHPDDDRYTRLVGETAILPLVGRRLQIIADEYVKPEFGTGALKITPGHDPNDFEIGRAHGLDEITVIGEDGRMTAEAGERFAGMTALEAREAVVAALRAEGRIARTEPYRPQRAVLAALGRADRAADLAAVVHAHGRARQAGDRGRPQRARPDPPRGPGAPLLRVDGEHPPVVHLAPALVGTPDPGLVPRRRRALRRHGAARGRRLGARPRRARHLVLERLWPFATLGWPDETAELKAFYPTDVLSTARDILFLWVARMVMMGLEFVGDIPFDRRLRALDHPGARRAADVEVARHRDRPAGPDRRRPAPAGLRAGRRVPGLRRRRRPLRPARDVLDPGRALQRGEDRPGPPARQQALERGAARAAARARGRHGAGRPRPPPQTVEDAWILSRLQAAKADVARSIDAFEFHHAALGLYDFVYGELCDWYLEMLKPRLYADDNRDVASSRCTCSPRRWRSRTR